MKTPPHPGLTVKHDCLEELGLSIAQGAKVLGVRRQALNNIVSGKGGILPEMAARLAKAFGSSPETWLGMQADYDLAQLRSGDGEIRVERGHARSTIGRRSADLHALGERSGRRDKYYVPATLGDSRTLGRQLANYRS